MYDFNRNSRMAGVVSVSEIKKKFAHLLYSDHRKNFKSYVMWLATYQTMVMVCLARV